MAISFELSEEEQLLQRTAREFATERLWPRVRETEKAREIDVSVAKEAHELGFTVLDVPDHAGGQDIGLLGSCLIEEQLAWGDVAACYALGGPGAMGSFALELASKEQQKDLFAPFVQLDGYTRYGAVAWSEPRASVAAAMMTEARVSGHGYALQGRKSFVVNGDRAERHIVIAQLDSSLGYRGLGAFVVERGPAIVTQPRRQALGLDAAHIAELGYEGAQALYQLGEGDLTEPLLRAFARHSMIRSARAVGLATRAWELARDYCEERKAFGKPIGHFQSVAFLLADRLMDTDSARWLLWRAASNWDQKQAPDLCEVASACAHASEIVMRCADDAVQLFGGAGFIRDYAVEKCFRDARQLALMGAPATVWDQLLADQELGRPLDPEVVLPISDVQAVCV